MSLLATFGRFNDASSIAFLTIPTLVVAGILEGEDSHHPDRSAHQRLFHTQLEEDSPASLRKGTVLRSFH